MIKNPTSLPSTETPECFVRKEPEPSKANYDLDQSTEENSKNPSLNSILGCLKVVDTFRPTWAKAAALVSNWGLKQLADRLSKLAVERPISS